ncbi:hypothetical protein NM688_g586 [Phlebia brevispora]|uniref:Uncharacterized protein n=1 Tax=Phlebia brevispora TaxID=194682 RepID=A0ACC1TE22_9APHY|nr:hypothetical protein NM688_g586 [Phlebia brevispora]
MSSPHTLDQNPAALLAMVPTPSGADGAQASDVSFQPPATGFHEDWEVNSMLLLDIFGVSPCADISSGVCMTTTTPHTVPPVGVRKSLCQCLSAECMTLQTLTDIADSNPENDERVSADASELLLLGPVPHRSLRDLSPPQNTIDIPGTVGDEDGAVTPLTELAEEDVADEDNDELAALGLRLVPQRRYVASHQAPRELRQVVYTWGGSVGIPLEAVVAGNLDGIDSSLERDTFSIFKKKIHYRLEWPGYKSFAYAKNVRGSTGPITRAAVVVQIVEMIEAFIDENASQASQDPEWRVGPDGITVESLVLVGLDFVSQGSVQPRLANATVESCIFNSSHVPDVSYHSVLFITGQELRFIKALAHACSGSYTYGAQSTRKLSVGMPSQSETQRAIVSSELTKPSASSVQDRLATGPHLISHGDLLSALRLPRRLHWMPHLSQPRWRGGTLAETVHIPAISYNKVCMPIDCKRLVDEPLETHLASTFKWSCTVKPQVLNMMAPTRGDFAMLLVIPEPRKNPIIEASRDALFLRIFDTTLFFRISRNGGDAQLQSRASLSCVSMGCALAAYSRSAQFIIHSRLGYLCYAPQTDSTEFSHLLPGLFFPSDSQYRGYVFFCNYPLAYARSVPEEKRAARSLRLILTGYMA